MYGVQETTPRSLETTREVTNPCTWWAMASQGAWSFHKEGQGPDSRGPKKNILGYWPLWGRRLDDIQREKAVWEEVILKQEPLPLPLQMLDSQV